MVLFKLLLLILLIVVCCKGEEETEEKDPWDKSTDKYWHNGGGGKATEGQVDVTEETDSEVHTQKSKVAKGKTALQQPEDMENVDKKTQDKFSDELDEQNPNESQVDFAPINHKSTEKTKKTQEIKNMLSKKTQFNLLTDDIHPVALWRYPYLYFNPQFAGLAPCACNQGHEIMDVEDLDDEEEKTDYNKMKKKRKSKNMKSRNYFPHPPSGGFGQKHRPPHPPPRPNDGSWIPYYQKKHHVYSPRQLVPTHYYGPPSAGWGGFQPGQSGVGWGVPYWYRKRHQTHHKTRQIIPSHYYGPPSAGWRGFQPGRTGSGWGVPYWYKK